MISVDFSSRKLEQIRSLQIEVTECSKKLATLEQDRQKSLEDMAWAQNYCFSMDKKIKELENELSQYRPVLLDGPDQNYHLAMLLQSKESTDGKDNLVKLKLRKDLT